MYPLCKIVRAVILALTLVILSGALCLSTSSFWSVTADVGANSAGTVSGVMNMGNQIGGAVTASLTPIIAAHFGWTASFLVAAILCALRALGWLFVEPERVFIKSSARPASDSARYAD